MYLLGVCITALLKYTITLPTYYFLFRHLISLGCGILKVPILAVLFFQKTLYSVGDLVDISRKNEKKIIK